MFDSHKVRETLKREAEGLDSIDINLIMGDILKNVYDGVNTKDLEKSIVLSTKSFIEKECKTITKM